MKAEALKPTPKAPSQKRADLGGKSSAPRKNAKDYNAVFESYILRLGLKYTRQRKTLLKAIFSIDRHFEIEHFISDLYQAGTAISRGTVYSTIKLLQAAGLIRKIHSHDNKVYYEHVYGHDHDHVICTNCNKVFEFRDEAITERQFEICKKLGIQPQSHSYNIFGSCADEKNCPHHAAG